MAEQASKKDRPGQGERLQALMIGHGSLVIVIGLLSGFGLMFKLLGEVAIWPIPWGIDAELPGTARGWQAAHVGGILNGVLVLVIAKCLPLLALADKTARRIAWALIFTGWANTVFYLFGNFAANRGLSGGTNALGEGSLAGFIAYLPAALATVVTTVAIAAVARAAFRRAGAGKASA